MFAQQFVFIVGQWPIISNVQQLIYDITLLNNIDWVMKQLNIILSFFIFSLSIACSQPTNKSASTQNSTADSVRYADSIEADARDNLDFKLNGARIPDTIKHCEAINFSSDSLPDTFEIRVPPGSSPETEAEILIKNPRGEVIYSCRVRVYCLLWGLFEKNEYPDSAGKPGTVKFLNYQARYFSSISREQIIERLKGIIQNYHFANCFVDKKDLPDPEGYSVWGGYDSTLYAEAKEPGSRLKIVALGGGACDDQYDTYITYSPKDHKVEVIMPVSDE